MNLHQKQALFSDLFSRLVQQAQNFGYVAVIDRVSVPGDSRCHGMRLAGDLLLFKPDGTYIKNGFDESYKKCGKWWKSQHPLCRWGGDFKGKNAGDGNHFSITHGGKS